MTRLGVGVSARRVWRWAVRLDGAAGILIVLALVTALGSCFPQLTPEVAADPQRLADWIQRLRTQHGAWADFYLSTGAVRFFDTPVFIVLWAGLLLATLLCTLHRWRTVWRSVGQPPIRCPDAILDSAPCAALVRALPGSQPTHVLQQALEQRGFRVRVETADSASYLRADRYRLAQLATLVTHLAVFPLLAGVLLNTQLAWRTELTLPPGQAVEVGHGSGMRVSNEGFAVVRYADGNIASYEADVRVQGVHARVRVNEPFVLEGVGFYLRGYQSRANETVLTLLAAYEPGYGPVIAAGFLFLCGMTVTFAFPACRVQARLGVDGTLHLAGWPQRQAVGFEREFAAWVAAVSGGAAEAAGERRS